MFHPHNATIMNPFSFLFHAFHAYQDFSLMPPTFWD